MRAYTVQAGDSPASIAGRFAGCPKCSRDLVLANRAKPTIVYPNGYETFVGLSAGEELALPERWFDGTLDRMPQSYFDALPSADGQGGAMLSTFGSLGASPVGSIAQMGLNSAGTIGSSAAYTFAADTIDAQIPGASSTLAQGIAVANGVAGMSSSQLTQVTAAVTERIADAILPGAGILLQAILSAIGFANSGAGKCEPAGPPPALLPAGPANSFENAFNALARTEWIQDGVCPQPHPGIGPNPQDFYLLWSLMLATTIQAWNGTNDTSGAMLSDVDGAFTTTAPKGGLLTIARTVQVPTSVTFGGKQQFTYGPQYADAIGLALDAHAAVVNTTLDPNPNPNVWGPGDDPTQWPVPPNSVITFAVNTGNVHAPVGIGPGLPPFQPPPQKGAGGKAAATTSSAAKGIVVVAGASAAGIGLYAHLTHQAYAAAARQLWHKATKQLRRVRP